MPRPIILLFLVLAFTGCYEAEEPTELGLEMFPINLGHWVEYEVDTVWMDEPVGSLGAGERHYLLRELNESTYLDDEGRDMIRVERTWRADTTVGWSIKDIWGKVRTTSIAEQNEDNLILRKLIFPLGEGKIWNGTIRTTDLNLQEWTGFLNIPTDWDFTMTDLNMAYTVNGLTFDSTVTVTQINRPTAFGLSVYSKDVYAKNVGMVHRFMTIYTIQPNPDGQDKDSTGYYYEAQITDFSE